MRTNRSIRLAVALIATLLAAACARHREEMSSEALLQKRDVELQERTDRMSDAIGKLVQHLDDQLKADPKSRPSLDVLVLSGGGDWGSFGTGYLLGWKSLSGADAMPNFDVVLGVSTGALIAPFAYLGTEADLRTIDNLYRNPKSDWVKERGILFFLPGHESFAEVPGLEREVHDACTTDTIARIAKKAEGGSVVAVNTTDIDLGTQRPWDLSAEAIVASKSGDTRKFENILLASSGIPGAFPPREIDGELYVDGGVTSNIIYGGAVRKDLTVQARWNASHPNGPKLLVRYWVILNNKVMSDPKVIQPTWPAILGRSVELAIRSSTVTSLRHLFTIGELITCSGQADCEVRYVAIPSTWQAPKEGVFVKESMIDLSNVGMKMGADPKTWQTVAP
ncbi:MAG: patatin-like phospholipase family protein [Planctomycetaceae bacterium]|nr:patatin-like phospholipase family protein [Planctomycetaceae bacterium]